MTGRGWAILATAGVSLAAGRLLGLEDLYLVGVGLALVLMAANAYVRVVRPRLEASRQVLPARVHAGTASRVELSLVNRSTRHSPVVAVRDPFDGGARWARFLVAPLVPDEVAHAAYRLPTERRGVYDLGPLQVALSDPLGLATAVVEAAPRTRLTVYPRIDAVAPPPSTHGDDPLAGADHPRALTGGGEDFYALRPYVRGDDLRKVHWPSTAKTDDLMLRQDEMPWQARSTLLLDTRTDTCPPVALELLVSAAASVVVAAARHDGLQRVLTTGGFDSRSAGSSAHVEVILDHLAGLRSSAGQLVPAIATLRRTQGGGALVVMTTALASTPDLRALAAVRSRFGGVTLVVVERSAWDAGGARAAAGELDGRGAPRPVPTGLRVVRVTAAHPFAAAWAAVAGAPGDIAPAGPRTSSTVGTVGTAGRVGAWRRR